MVMRGYWNGETQTRETIDDARWLHSGDLGTMDEGGYITITGRSKDMVIRGGENVYPREIEEFLFRHPTVADVQVFGVPDDRYGEELCAWIRLKPGAAATEEEIRAFCRTLALRIGHRQSVDFDFFSRAAFDPATLAREIPYLAGAETVQLESHTLTCRVERGGPVLVSFFGNLNLGEAAPREDVQGSKLHVASLLDIAGTQGAHRAAARATARLYRHQCADPARRRAAARAGGGSRGLWAQFQPANHSKEAKMSPQSPRG
jgi:AMP-binding enzyme/AMP-binding enzyme C-terminal domain